MTDLIPLKLRKHLIPFFYKEFEGIEGRYFNKKVKAAKIVLGSSIGKMIAHSLQRCDYPKKAEKFNLFITIFLSDKEKSCEAELYRFVSGSYYFLEVSKETTEEINDIFEDFFRMALVYAVEYGTKYNKNIKVIDVLTSFMVDYELDEYGYTIESLRKVFHRGKDQKVTRTQKKIANRVKNRT